MLFYKTTYSGRKWVKLFFFLFHTKRQHWPLTNHISKLINTQPNKHVLCSLLCALQTILTRLYSHRSHSLTTHNHTVSLPNFPKQSTSAIAGRGRNHLDSSALQWRYCLLAWCAANRETRPSFVTHVACLHLASETPSIKSVVKTTYKILNPIKQTFFENVLAEFQLSANRWNPQSTLYTLHLITHKRCCVIISWGSGRLCAN